MLCIGSVLPVSSLDHVPPRLPVGWDEAERCWVDHLSDMRFNPLTNSYFRFVSDDLLDLRCLYYIPSGDSLVLDVDGLYASMNSTLLASSSWDRTFIYSPDTVAYDPCLAALFRPFAGLLGDIPLVSSQDIVDDGDSSSSEE
jgi:hypothetical protein